MDIRTGTSVSEATSEGVKLSNGEFVPTRTLIWCVGVRPDPLVESLGLPTEKGRLLVDEYLNMPGHPEIFACGDAAAVPDLTRPGKYTAMTAQHATRQGKRAAYNVAASYGHGERKPYKHSDLGFVVDLGDAKAAANPLGVPLSGVVAKAVTRGYHLLAIPGGRARIAGSWLLDALLPRQTVQLGVVRAPGGPPQQHLPRGPLQAPFQALPQALLQTLTEPARLPTPTEPARSPQCPGPARSAAKTTESAWRRGQLDARRFVGAVGRGVTVSAPAPG